MSDVTIQTVQPVLGLPDGVTVTVERTRRVQAAIDAGRVRVVGSQTPPLPVLPDETPEVD